MADTQIVIDLDKMTIADLAILDNPDDMGEFIDLLDRVVEGGASHRPVMELRQIKEAIKVGIREVQNPKN